MPPRADERATERIKKERYSVSVLLTLILSLSLLTGCKSAKVKAVEETIKAIGTVAIDSGDSMAAAEDLYHALSVEDQGKVSKAGTLAEASKALADMMAQAFLEDMKQLAPAFVIESDGGTLVNDPVILPHITRLSCWARTKDISVNTEPSPTRRTPPSRRQIRTATCWKFSWTSTAGLQASRSGFPRS